MTATARERITAYAEAHEIEVLFLEPAETFDAAIVGVVYGNGQEPAVLYDEALVLKGLAREMSADDALDWFEVNTVGSYVGPATPRFLVCRR